MYNLEVKEILIEERSYSYGHGINNVISRTTRATQIVPLEAHTAYTKWVAKLKSSGKIVPKKTVYFDKSVDFPRKKFKESFPENPITIKPDKADIVILDLGKVKRENIYWYSYTMHQIKRDPDVWVRRLESGEASLGTIDILHTYRPNDTKRLIERISTLYKYDGKYIVDIQDLSLKSDTDLDDEMFDRLNTMMNATDDMRRLAMNMLTAYDYNKNSARIALLLNLNWELWRVQRNKKENVEIKAMLRKLDLDYPGLKAPGYTFWIGACLNAPDDPVIQKAFNIWIKRACPGAPEVKLIKV